MRRAMYPDMLTSSASSVRSFSSYCASFVTLSPSQKAAIVLRDAPKAEAARKAALAAEIERGERAQAGL